jgi:glycosyltransferase involved in cell wall biosynthesis
MAMKVLMAHSRDGIGGSVLTGAMLAKVGCESGHWSAICVCNSPGPVLDLHRRLGLDAVALADAANLRYEPDPSDGSRIRRIFKRLFLIRAARRFLRSESPDVIHVHDESSALAWGLAARGRGIPVVWQVHQQEPQWLVDWLLRRLASHVVFVADRNRTRFGSLGKTRHSLVYNGVDLAQFEPRREDASGAVTVAFVSNLVDRKRPEWVIRAAGRLVREGHDVDVLLAGNDFTGGVKARELDTLAQTEGLLGAGLATRYRYLGYRPDVAEVLRQVDVLALPSQRDKEAFPRIIVEAMACGLPVVATAVGGIPEAVEHGETGILVDPDDLEGFVQALRSLVTDHEMRRRFGAAAIRRSKDRFSLSASAEAMRRIYGDLVHQPST